MSGTGHPSGAGEGSEGRPVSAGGDGRGKPRIHISLDSAIDKIESHRSSKEGLRAVGGLKGQMVRGWTEKLLTRTTSGAIYSIVILLCLFGGVVPTTVCITAMSWLCCSEFFRISRMGGRMPNEILGLTGAIAYPVSMYLWGFGTIHVVTFALVLSLAVWYVVTPRANLADVAITVFGPIYTSLMFSCIVLIRKVDPGFDGALLTLGVMGSMWANDAMAYFIGSRFGAHKLAPKISPHKSWEGFYGGLAGSILIWSIVGMLGLEGIGMGLALVCGVVVGISAVIGDLFESRIKRGVGVKDSGNLMPGHGGLLDRSDSMLFGCTVAYFLLHIGGIL